MKGRFTTCGCQIKAMEKNKGCHDFGWQKGVKAKFSVWKKTKKI